VNRPGAAADRRRAEGTAPRIAGPGDVLTAGIEAAPERPSRCQPNSLGEATAALRARKELAIRGAEQATQRQRARGKMTVRERLEALLAARVSTSITRYRRRGDHRWSRLRVRQLCAKVRSGLLIRTAAIDGTIEQYEQPIRGGDLQTPDSARPDDSCPRLPNQQNPQRHGEERA